eukprot:COSAG01_NODE_34205_length_551_cov_1.309735_2_plen_83_part_01
MSSADAPAFVVAVVAYVVWQDGFGGLILELAVPPYLLLDSSPAPASRVRESPLPRSPTAHAPPSTSTRQLLSPLHTIVSCVSP